MPRGQDIAAKLSPVALCRWWMTKRKPFGHPGSSAGRPMPVQSLPILCCLTLKAAASASNHFDPDSTGSCRRSGNA